ncbi:MAG TPA: peptide chain release factor N(5)-glutamine methyltransferase [Ignavibacteriaceae bacterium]|nr:peptide chain release factor N(5)-glutamine methyltransferase [Ignavibacteriaceae bacterium]
MLTVLEAVKLSADYLQKKGIESPRLNAELLLAHLLNCKRLDLYLLFDRPLKENEIILYRELLKKRGSFVPLQYIIGNVEFYGLEFSVDSSVLIPRPETELLVDTIIEENKNTTLKILDIGTGSGIIAIALAKSLEQPELFAIDISEAALANAKKNAIKNDVTDRIKFLQLDVRSDLSLLKESFDIIVSNPPYISKDEFPKLQTELRVFEPAIALTDYADGLSFFKIISEKAIRLLKNNGKLYFEIGKDQSDSVKKILQENGFANIQIKKDYQEIDRVISGEK